MLLATIIISIILVAFIMLALGIKLLFNRDAEFIVHSCALEEGGLDKDGSCSLCHLKDLADCPENEVKHLTSQ
jgi:hypothetical protein